MMDWFCGAGQTRGAASPPQESCTTPPHLREAPGHLLDLGGPVTVDELREAADLIVHHAASVFPCASQRTQEELSIFGVTSQLKTQTDTLIWERNITFSSRSSGFENLPGGAVLPEAPLKMEAEDTSTPNTTASEERVLPELLLPGEGTWGPHPWQGCRVAVWFSFMPWSMHRWLTFELRI